MTTLNIDQFNPTVAELHDIATEARAITKDNEMKDIKAMRLKLRDVRVRITKKGKEMRADAIAFQKAVIAKEEELTSIIGPEEDRLKGIEEEAAAVIERARRMELMPRRRELLDGLFPDGVAGPTDEELLAMDDDQYAAYRNTKVEEKNNRDRQAIEDGKKAEREKQERIKKRFDQLAVFGVSRSFDELAEMSDEQFAAILKEAKADYDKKNAAKAEDDAKIREAKARKDERFRHRIKTLEAAGLTTDIADRKMTYEDIEVGFQEIDDAEEPAFRELEGKLHAQVDAKKAKAKEAAEAAERARLERQEAYRKWRAGEGWTPETKHLFEERKIGSTIELWKKCGAFSINE